jgi:hypothetical protein
MKAFTRICLLIILLFSVKLALAQTFTAKASATVIGRSDVVQVEYVADNVSLDQFTLPRFNKWTVVSGPNMSSSTVQTGNTIKQQIVYSVMLQPEAIGNLVIPGATALVDNKPTKSNGVIIQVKNVDHIGSARAPAQQVPHSSLFDKFPFEDELPSAQYLKKGERAIDKIKNNIVVRLEVNKKTCYVGEPILATYKLCTRLRSKSKVVKQPQFSGATVIELTEEDQDQHIEKINGQEYNVFVIRRVELFPLAPGQLVLPATSVENKVSFYNAGQLSYRDLYYGSPSAPVEEQLVTLENKPTVVNVIPLPAFPTVGNSEFSGAVGDFDFSISTTDKVSTNATNNLYITVQGSGNLQDLKQPFVQWPKGIEAFDATQKAEDDKTDFPVRSRMTYTIPFVVDKKGMYTIPPIEFTYFNANANKYVTKSTHALVLNVVQGQKNILKALNPANAETGFQQRLYIILGAGVLAIIIGLLWYNARQKAMLPATTAQYPIAPAQTVVAKAEPIAAPIKPDASEYLYAIRELQPDGNSSLFYKNLCKNLHAYLQNKFGIEPSQLSYYIQTQSENAALLEQLKVLLDNCSLGMYTPVFSIEEAMQHRLQAIEVLQKLERE